ncbi:MAG: 30S ribosomal protein S20 [Candidatus Liptonbacteria bacterium RIFOXYC1_FULL_36_8]|uniref:Small ribosomal subunit protein bS20 n=3 Tax=Candidatus Liptoniibacteriota TaxID=1817909 RepID=A0A1G2CN69_9BACT|nr:MAG: 30S ribosomal protein S20 [Candidatus Liptonbacteria bacterium RIFOXYB1_FULL_36_10]OGZ03290.1 MAG: 30S ribosomal protein S20 [Candidatus Liptonbacteria bacterium RIFOXYD1_FULL_36_11]OGZ03652.1 MAG: 30S ribosomal protein S20 [Candidatus Liptonbacteria bacterium RIFOXYC1_FULL_36_8]
MPNTKSAKKALRQNERRRKKNLNDKGVLKSAIKDYKKSLSSGKKEEVLVKLSLVYKKLDKAAKNKLISKNKAGRLKSRMAKKVVKSSV